MIVDDLVPDHGPGKLEGVPLGQRPGRELPDDPRQTASRGRGAGLGLHQEVGRPVVEVDHVGEVLGVPAHLVELDVVSDPLAVLGDHVLRGVVVTHDLMHAPDEVRQRDGLADLGLLLEPRLEIGEERQGRGLQHGPRRRPLDHHGQGVGAAEARTEVVVRLPHLAVLGEETHRVHVHPKPLRRGRHLRTRKDDGQEDHGPSPARRATGKAREDASQEAVVRTLCGRPVSGRFGAARPSHRGSSHKEHQGDQAQAGQEGNADAEGEEHAEVPDRNDLAHPEGEEAGHGGHRGHQHGAPHGVQRRRHRVPAPHPGPQGLPEVSDDMNPVGAAHGDHEHRDRRGHGHHGPTDEAHEPEGRAHAEHHGQGGAHHAAHGAERKQEHEHHDGQRQRTQIPQIVVDPVSDLRGQDRLPGDDRADVQTRSGDLLIHDAADIHQQRILLLHVDAHEHLEKDRRHPPVVGHHHALVHRPGIQALIQAGDRIPVDGPFLHQGHRAQGGAAHLDGVRGGHTQDVVIAHQERVREVTGQGEQRRRQLPTPVQRDHDRICCAEDIIHFVAPMEHRVIRGDHGPDVVVHLEIRDPEEQRSGADDSQGREDGEARRAAEELSHTGYHTRVIPPTQRVRILHNRHSPATIRRPH